MREVLPRTHKYFYPLPKKDMKEFFRNVFGPAILGQNTMLIVPSHLGGGKSLVDFSWRNRKWLAEGGVKQKLFEQDDYIFSYIDLYSITYSSENDFLVRLFYNLLSFYTESKEKSLPNSSLLDKIRFMIKQITLKNNLIVGVRNLQNMKDPTNLFSSLRVNPLINFIFIAYQDNMSLTNKTNLLSLKRSLCKNIHEIPFPHNSAIDYVINRWSSILHCDFKLEEKDLIKKYSSGSFIRLKQLCIFFANNQCENLSISSMEDKLIDYLQRFHFKKYLFINPNSSNLSYNGQDITSHFTNTEITLLRLFLSKPGLCVTRDSIFDALYDESFSDSCISDIVSHCIFRIRKKFARLGIDSVKIKTLYGKGYSLSIAD